MRIEPEDIRIASLLSSIFESCVSNAKTLDLDCYGASSLVAQFANQILNEAQQWRPIESAPRSTSTYILGYNANGHGEYFLMRTAYSDDAKVYAVGAGFMEKYSEWPCYPTHWIPLPPPPAQTEENK